VIAVDEVVLGVLSLLNISSADMGLEVMQNLFRKSPPAAPTTA
jgi:hypothetical protein